MEIWCSYNKHLPEKWSFQGKDTSFKNIKFPRDNYKTDSSETQTHSIVFIVHYEIFFRAPVQKSIIELISTFLNESRESQMKILKKKTDKTPLIQFQLFVFYKTRLFT